MTIELFAHPFSSYCQKAITAFYENDTPFELRLLEPGSPASDEFAAIWPIGKFPVLRDDARGQTVPESSIIIEYLAQHYPGRVPLVPTDPDLAREVRLRDRFFDLYVSEPMQKVITDRLRPDGQHDHYGVAQARDRLRVAFDLLEQDMASRTWAIGDAFSMADCAAAPALFYANMILALEIEHPHTAAYLLRLMQRPSFARVLKEAQPYLHMVPKETAEA